MRLVGRRQPLIVWLSVLTEIEGMAFIALGIVLRRADLFLDIQSALFPAALLVATVTALATIWLPRRRAAAPVAVPVEAIAATDLAKRIGVAAEDSAPAVPAASSPSRPSAAWRRALDQRR